MAPFAARGTTEWLVAKTIVRGIGYAIALAAFLLALQDRARWVTALEQRFGRGPAVAMIGLLGGTIGAGAGLAYRLMAR